MNNKTIDAIAKIICQNEINHKTNVTLVGVPRPIEVYDNSTLTADEIRKLKYIRNQKDYLER